MLIFRGCEGLADSARGAAVAIGNFDGVHRGHQAVIGTAGRLAREAGLPHAVLTFEPHPRSVFRPDDPPFRLTPFPMKARLIETLGVDLLFALPFDRSFAAKTAETFVEEVLVDGLGVAHVVAGYDFVFGNKRRGTPTLLGEMGRSLGFGVTIMDPVEESAGDIYSATGIREKLLRGEPREAARRLGRFWEVEGPVATGDKLGRVLGFPTANIALGDHLRPATGIYAVRAAVVEAGEAAWRDAVASFGWRPTVGGTDLRFEVHLLDFEGDLYGRTLRVQLVEYLRPEAKFDGLDRLKEQIAADAAQARAVLSRS
jgi:riboflavin kinase/FMN adenylyltransferase